MTSEINDGTEPKLLLYTVQWDNALEANVVKSKVLEFLQAVVIYRDQVSQK